MKFIVTKEQTGQRIDSFLASQVEDFSRAKIQEYIAQVKVNNKPVKKNYKVCEGDVIKFTAPEIGPSTLKPVKQKLEIIYEDDDILAINKDPFVPVHPDKKQSHEVTLVNILLGNKVPLSTLGGNDRPGIVHRLDMDTSGIILIAKTDKAYKHLQEQFQNREISKTYYALCWGSVTPRKGRIEAPIGRDFKDRKKMRVSAHETAKDAISEYEVIKTFNSTKITKAASLLKVKIPTGRTHQIRVHLQSIGFPIIGDKTYGNEKLNRESTRLRLERQFLHAKEIEFTNLEGKKIKLEAELKADLVNFLEAIKA